MVSTEPSGTGRGHSFSRSALGVAAAVAGIGLSWGAFALSTGENEAAGQDPRPQATSHFRFCFSGSPGLAMSAGAIRTALEQSAEALGASQSAFQALEARREPGYRPVPFNKPEVVEGCPRGFAPLPDEANLKAHLPIVGELVAEKSPYQVHIFVVPDEDMAALMAGRPGYFRAAYEMSCTGHSCAEVSTALYVSETVASNPGLLVRALEAAAGWENRLRPAYPQGRPESETGGK